LPMEPGYVEFSTSYKLLLRSVGVKVGLTGLVKPTSGGFASGAQVLVAFIPSGFRPASQTYFAMVSTSSTSVFARVYISGSGAVYVRPSAACSYISLEVAWWA